jgi:hypothetical protein
VSARRIDRTIYGRIVEAWQHFPSDALLIHFKPRSRTAAGYHCIGAWYVSASQQLLAVKPYYGRAAQKAPLRWATRKLRQLRCDSEPSRRADLPQALTELYGGSAGGGKTARPRSRSKVRQFDDIYRLTAESRMGTQSISCGARAQTAEWFSHFATTSGFAIK